MKIKNILYVASLVAIVSLNAAEQHGATAESVVVHVDAQPQIPQQRTSADVLGELALLYPAPAEVQKNFFGRAGDHIRTAGVYAYHVGKYPVAASAFCLPLAIKCKNDFMSSLDRSIDWVIYGVVGAAAIAGFCFGPIDARKELATKKIAGEAPVNVRRLDAAATKIADLENVHGTLRQIEGNLTGLQAGCQAALNELTRLQAASATTQRQLEDANTQLKDVVKKQQEEKISRLIATLQAAIRDTTATWEKFDAIRRDSSNGQDVQERLSVAMAAFQATQIFEEAMVAVHGFGEDIDPRHQGILQDLRARLSPVLDQRQQLKARIEGIHGTLSLEFQQAQQIEQRRLDDTQRQQTLEAAVATYAPRAVTPPVQVMQVQSMIATPCVLVHGVGGRMRLASTPSMATMMGRPVTPAVASTTASNRSTTSDDSLVLMNGGNQ